MPNDEYVLKRKRDVVQIVERAKAGDIGLLLAARKINRVLHELPELEKVVSEDDFLFLTGVVSECDELPLDTERQYWASDALREYDMRAKQYETEIAADLRAAFSRIARLFGAA